MSIRVLTDYGGTTVRLLAEVDCGVIHVIYQDDAFHLNLQSEPVVSVEVCFIVGVFEIPSEHTCDQLTYLKLQESLAKRLEYSNIVSSSVGGCQTNVVLTTSISSLLQALSGSERTKLLFDDNSSLRGWVKIFSLGGTHDRLQ